MLAKKPLKARFKDWNENRKARKAARQPSPLVEFERSRIRKKTFSRGLKTAAKLTAAVSLVAAIGYGGHQLKSRGDARRVQSVIELYEKNRPEAVHSLYPSMSSKSMVALDQFSLKLDKPLLTVLKAIEVSGVSVFESRDPESYGRQAKAFGVQSLALSKKLEVESKIRGNQLGEIADVLKELGRIVAREPNGDLVKAIVAVRSTKSTQKIVIGAENAWRSKHAQ